MSQNPLLISAAYFILILHVTSFAEILFKHCLGPADIGGLGEQGIFPNVCVQRHRFVNRSHSWSFWNSIIADTQFISCTFRNERKQDQNFLKSSWRNVTFANCTFEGGRGSGPIKFEETYFQDVVFEGCNFESSAKLVFSRFLFSNVEFRNCSFQSDTLAELGTIRRLQISRSVFGRGSTPAETFVRADVGAGKLEFAQMAIEGFQMLNVSSSDEIRFRNAQIENLEILNSTLNVVACHERLVLGRDAVQKAKLKNLFIKDTTFTDGLYCDQSILQGVELQNISTLYSIDISNSDIQRAAIFGINSLKPEEMCSTFDISKSRIRGNRFQSINTTKVIFAGTVFLEHIVLDGLSLMNTSFDIRNAVFASEKINNECCTESCTVRKCKCDVPLKSLFCPRGDSSVNVNMNDSCFPAQSKVTVVDNYDIRREVYLHDLQMGDRALASMGSKPSEIFFFGHRNPHASALYIILDLYSAEGLSNQTVWSLRVSPGHFIPVVHRGIIAARKIKSGDVLRSATNENIVVRSIRHEVLQGMYAPTTLNGKIAVDGVQVSCYTETVPAALAHALLTPLRLMYRFGPRGRQIVARATFLHDRSEAWIAQYVTSF